MKEKLSQEYLSRVRKSVKSTLNGVTMISAINSRAVRVRY